MSARSPPHPGAPGGPRRARVTVILEADVPVAHRPCHSRIPGASDSCIRALPQGYNTELSGSGSRKDPHLTVGQQQLLALARAPVHNPAACLLEKLPPVIDRASDAAFRRALRVSGALAGLWRADGRAPALDGPRS